MIKRRSILSIALIDAAEDFLYCQLSGKYCQANIQNVTYWREIGLYENNRVRVFVICSVNSDEWYFILLLSVTVSHTVIMRCGRAHLEINGCRPTNQTLALDRAIILYWFIVNICDNYSFTYLWVVPILNNRWLENKYTIIIRSMRWAFCDVREFLLPQWLENG